METQNKLHETLVALIRNGSVPKDTLAAGFEEILSGSARTELIAAVLTALLIRGVCGDDLAASAKVMRRHARSVNAPDDVVDTCGTGGLSWSSLNTSTAAAIVAAAAGARIAKHGNRSTPPKTGSADVIEALGVNLDPNDANIQNCLNQARIAFLFARSHHAAMRHVSAVRQILGIATIFNLIGPLANPANARRHILGVSNANWQQPMAEALRQLDIVHGMVVHGINDGLDEISVSGPTRILLIRNRTITQHTVTPNDLGVPAHPPGALEGGSPQNNAQEIRNILDGQKTPFADAVTVNAGAALVVADLAESLAEGRTMAVHAIASGKAQKTLDALIACSHGEQIQPAP